MGLILPVTSMVPVNELGVIVLDAGVVIALLERLSACMRITLAAEFAVLAAGHDGNRPPLFGASTYSEILVGPARQGAAAVAEVGMDSATPCPRRWLPY